MKNLFSGKRPSESNNKPSGANLPSWRDVVEPRRDVSSGTYQDADFAADLNDVVLERAADIYQKPTEFFSRTYLTKGMRDFLAQAVKRVSGLDGDPVIQLKTSFGGGKTHSMLALYHLLRNPDKTGEMGCESVLSEAGVVSIPKTNVAVVVGTAIDPFGKTIWGEIVRQLARNAGKEELFDSIKESNRLGISPGSERLREIFDACSPCLILIDELVAYGRKLYNPEEGKKKTRTRFESFTSFLQELTEAIKSSKNSVLVASIPESKIELGGVGGEIVLKMIEKNFGRVETVWKPIEEEEGFEIVRSRLFKPCDKKRESEHVCAVYSRMYDARADSFPVNAKSSDYYERLTRCYPFHPEFFDALYKEWSTLEKFQRTRGVLRLAAKIVQELWKRGDKSPLIAPGWIPFDSSEVRQEFLKYLPESNVWQTILESEVDGKNAESVKLDSEHGNFGQYNASRRVARAVFLRTAPQSREQGTTRGVKTPQVLLGVVEPDEQDKAHIFKDALSALRMRSSYLYSAEADSTYYYDSRPSLRKKMQERAQKIDSRDVEKVVVERLGKSLKSRYGTPCFAGVHICPESSSDVPDDDSTRLVVLGLSKTHNKTLGEESLAVKEASKILNYRGETPRVRKNVLAFVAPNDSRAESLRESIKNYLAWGSILKDSTELNLDESQKAEARRGEEQDSKTVDARINETYGVLLTPRIDVDADLSRIVWDANALDAGDMRLDAKAERAMKENETLIFDWAPLFLKAELDKYLWNGTEKNDVLVADVWDYLTTYCYAPRLKNFSVLQKTIEKGLDANLFAIASKRAEDEYVGLQFSGRVANIDKKTILVKREVAQKQIEREEAKNATQTPTIKSVAKTSGGASVGSNSSVAPTPPVPRDVRSVKRLSTFYRGEATLNSLRPVKDLDQIQKEIIERFPVGAKVTLLLTIDAQFPEGISPENKSVVAANSSTLKVDCEFGGEDSE